MSHSFLQLHACVFFQFAHGVVELRSREFDSKYKTELCLLHGNMVAKADGSTAAVESLKAGELLQGQDGRVVRVSSNERGECDEAFCIRVEGRGSYTVTPRHLVTVAVRDGKQSRLVEIEAHELFERRGELWAKPVVGRPGLLQHHVMARLCPIQTPKPGSAWQLTDASNQSDGSGQIQRLVQYDEPTDTFTYIATASSGSPICIVLQESTSGFHLTSAVERLERAWRLLGTFGRGVTVAAIAPNRSSKAGRGAAARELVERLGSDSSAVVVCAPGLHTDKERTAETKGFRADVPSQHSGNFSLTLSGRRRTVFLASHPSDCQTFDRLLDAFAAAHEVAFGERVAVPLDWAERLGFLAPLESVERMCRPGGFSFARMEVEALHTDGTEADHRFLLANDLLVHNCKNYYLFGPTSCFFASRCKFIRQLHITAHIASKRGCLKEIAQHASRCLIYVRIPGCSCGHS